MWPLSALYLQRFSRQIIRSLHNTPSNYKAFDLRNLIRSLRNLRMSQRLVIYNINVALNSNSFVYGYFAGT